MSIFLGENEPRRLGPQFSPSEKQNFDRICVADPLVGLFPSDPLRETPRTYISRGKRALGIEMSIFLEENAPCCRGPRFSPSEKQNFDRVGVADPLVGPLPSDPLRETPRNYISRGKRALGIWMSIFLEENVNPANRPRFSPSESKNSRRTRVVEPLPSDPLRRKLR